MPDKGAARRVQKGIDGLRKDNERLKKARKKYSDGTPGAKAIDKDIADNNKGIAHFLNTNRDLGVK